MPLPETYPELGDKYKDLPFLNLMLNMGGARVFYYRNKYRVYFTVPEGIIPAKIKTAIDTAGILNELIFKSNVADLKLYHPSTWNKKKKNKLKELQGEYELDNYEPIIRKYLLLLIWKDWKDWKDFVKIISVYKIISEHKIISGFLTKKIISLCYGVLCYGVLWRSTLSNICGIKFY